MHREPNKPLRLVISTLPSARPSSARNSRLMRWTETLMPFAVKLFKIRRNLTKRSSYSSWAPDSSILSHQSWSRQTTASNRTSSLWRRILIQISSIWPTRTRASPWIRSHWCAISATRSSALVPLLWSRFKSLVLPLKFQTSKPVIKGCHRRLTPLPSVKSRCNSTSCLRSINFRVDHLLSWSMKALLSWQIHLRKSKWFRKMSRD